MKVAGLSRSGLEGLLGEKGVNTTVSGPNRTAGKYPTVSVESSILPIGFANRSGGYEVRNPGFKGCISPKDISCVSLSGKKQDTCCVFE